MKTTLSLILVFVAVSLQLAAAQQGSLSAEAQERQGSCGGLVKQYPSTKTSSAPTTAASSAAPTSGAPSQAPSVSPSQGQCRWVCEGETGETSEVTPASGATGGVSGGVTGGSGATQPANVDYDCELTEAWYNMSLILTVEEREIFIQFIEMVKATILIDITLTDIEKVVACSYAFKHFCSEHVDIYYKIAFEFIGSWGYCIDFIYVSVDIQAVITQKIVTLDSNGDCELFDALLNGTQGNSQQYQAVLVLIEELRVEVFENVELTYAQKLAKCHEIFVEFFSVHVEWQSSFFSIQISGYGSFESFFEVCHGYHKALTISTVISGSSDSDCVLLAALTEAAANTSFSLSVRNQLKELHDKLQAEFVIEVDITIRLQYISTQCYQLFLVEEFIVQFLDMVSCEADGELWGIFYDILWCSQFCHNSGSCGNLDNGMGTSLAPSTSTAATTEVASTTEAAADCSKRPELITVSSSNTTILTDCLTQNYNTWNTSVKLGFNSYFNQIRNAIWDNVDFPTPAIKLANITTYFLNYNKNNVNAQNVVMNITITEWRGTIRQFCDCQSQS